MLAIHSVVRANGTGEMSSCAAMARPTGVSRTAVVSRLSTTVQATATSTNSSHSTGVRCRPAREAQWPATSNTPAASAISATTVMATKKTRTGRTRARTSPSSATFTAAATGVTGVPWRRGPTAGPALRPAARRTRRRRRRAPRPAGGTRRTSRPTRHSSRATRPAGVLGHVGGARARGPAPSGRRGRPGESTPRHTCWSGSRPRRHGPARSGSTRLSSGFHALASGPTPGQVDGHREAVGGDGVGGAHRAVEGRDDDEPAVRAALGGGVEGGVVERVVEDAGVDAGGGQRRRGVQHEVAGDLGGEVGADAQGARPHRGGR